MHRPLIWFSTAFSAGCGAVLLFDVSVPLAVAAVLLAAACAVGTWQPRLLPVCVLAAGVMCGMCYTAAYHRVVSDPVAELAGKRVRLTVTATDFATRYEENQRVEVRVNGEDTGSRNFRTLLYLPLTESDIQPGDTITGKTEFYIPDKREGFDRAGYSRSRGYAVLASIDGEISTEAPARRPVSYYPRQLARSLRGIFQTFGTERQAAFWSALTTGDRSGLTTADTDHLRKAGLSHVIALSGMHVGFLVSLLLFVFGKRIGTALGIPTLIAFFLMVGWSPSVVRACIMYGILLASFWLRQQADSVNSLFAALLVILIILPDALTSVSLQLSFASTLGILCFAARIQAVLALPKKIPKLLLRVYQMAVGCIACTICSMIFTAPILLYHFGYLSAFSVLSNVMALWAVSLVFPLLVVGGLLGFVWPSAAACLLTPAAFLTDWIYWVSDWTAGLPYGVLYCENTADLAWTIVLCLLAAVLLRKAHKRVVLAALPLLVVIVVGTSVWRGANGYNDLRIAVLPEGSGQAIVVSCGEQAALIDCSGSGYHNAAEDVAAYLDWWGIESLDLMILTSVDMGHARNACELLDTVPVGHVIVPAVNRENKEPYAAVMRALEAHSVRYEKLSPDRETAVGEASLGLSVLGGVERKLAVRIASEDQDILIVHAFTQNMLLELTDKTPLRCKTLVVSGGFSDSTEKMTELLGRLSPERIVLENGWTSGTEYNGIPILNPHEIGEIDWKTVRD